MMLVMCVSFYTSRVVLATLGVYDFGIYNIVGSIVVMFSSFNNSLNLATSRFLSYELEKGNFDRLNKTFSVSVLLHFCVAVIVFAMAETIGLWFLNNKIVISPERLEAAHFVFHISVITFMVSVMQVPYNASIIAHEEMGAFAYISIAEVFLRLLLVYLLEIANYDKLILYAVLMLFLAIIVSFLYKLYASRHYHECHFKLVKDKSFYMPLLRFFQWDFYGNLCAIIQIHGLNILLNTFFGVSVNAAMAVATQVKNGISVFTKNFFMAVRPQIYKQYASGNIKELENTLIYSSKISFVLLFIFALPSFIEMKYILNLWLTNVPDHAITFCRLFLVSAMLLSIITPYHSALHGTGNVKKLSLYCGTTNALAIPLAYYILINNAQSEYAIVATIIMEVISYLCVFYIVKQQIPNISLQNIIRKTMLPILCFALASVFFMNVFYNCFQYGLVRFLFIVFVGILFMIFIAFVILLDKNEKSSLISVLKRRLSA